MTPHRTRWKKVVTTVTLTTASFTLAGSSAQAFFPPWWPSTPPVVSPPVVVSPPPVTPPVVVPPVTPPPFEPPPPAGPPPITNPPPVAPPVVVPPTCPPPHTIPEPSTLVAGLAGLAAAAGWASRRRRTGGAG